MSLTDWAESKGNLELTFTELHWLNDLLCNVDDIYATDAETSINYRIHNKIRAVIGLAPLELEPEVVTEDDADSTGLAWCC